MRKKLLSGLQIVLALCAGAWFWYWIPRLASRPIAQFHASCEPGVPPSRAQSFYVSHGTCGFLLSPPLRENVLATVFVIGTFALLCIVLMLALTPAIQRKFGVGKGVESKALPHSPPK